MRPGSLRAAAKPVPPPLSPVLLLGLALKPVRPALLQPLFDGVLKMLRRRHPDILDRMADYSALPVCIDPVDLPFVIVLDPTPDNPRLTVCRDVDTTEVAATIHGPLELLLALAEGKVDGDALFFTRRLVIEGDTEVVVALRNAIDGAGIDLIADIAAELGPLARPFRSVASVTLGLLDRVQSDLDTLRSALIAPAVKGADAQEARIQQLEAEMKVLRKAARRGGVA
jgi:predicted lipid carrier protein YhbT